MAVTKVDVNGVRLRNRISTLRDAEVSLLAERVRSCKGSDALRSRPSGALTASPAFGADRAKLEGVHAVLERELGEPRLAHLASSGAWTE